MSSNRVFIALIAISQMFCLQLFSAPVSSGNVNPALGKIMNARGYTVSDITIPVNFDEEASSRGGFKLILPFVRSMMIDPMNSFSFPDSLLRYAKLSDNEFVMKMFGLAGKQVTASATATNFLRLYKLQDAIRSFYKKRAREKSIFTEYSTEERRFLKEKIFSMMSDPDDSKTDYSNIFSYNIARDSSIASSKRVVELLSRSDKNKFFSRCIEDYVIMLELFSKCKSGYLRSLEDEEYYSDEEGVDGDILYFEDEDGLRIAIGSNGANRYEGYFDLIIDTGGDDVYSLLPPPAFNKLPACIIDLGGNDVYSGKSDFSLASAFFGSSFIFDASGDDTYRGAGTSCASAICGLAVITDESGNDIYSGTNHSVGAATFGVSAIIDKQGNDIYSANSNSQGYGSTQGVGVISDLKGNDSYLVDSRSLDIGRYEDHYISMCQGYGNGVRPYYAGGIGLIIESEGNDIYNSDIFGQGGAYWFSLGCIADGGGNDKYNSYQYGQGAGIHLAVGLLKDFDGWDFYSSNGVSQGCGHDYGFGLLNDVAGNDNYSAYSLSQGAGNANGIGILLDESGRDGYLSKEPVNTRGYGNSRRDYGSIGLFADASGIDFYSVSGLDSTFFLGSMWGAFADAGELPEALPVSASTGFKVQVDSSRTYSKEELMIMAKTIEPRFSLWKDYGFRELVNDSSATSQFIFKYLGTDDHRTALVLRDLAQRIRHTMSFALEAKLAEYFILEEPDSLFSTDEISYMCYLLGEAGLASSREELLDLTYNDNRRIRASAVNALGKLAIDSTDLNFTGIAAERLRGLIAQGDSSRLYRKDIAFAMKKYRTPQNIPSLVSMLGDDFFGVRFLAAECLAGYGEEYYATLGTSEIETRTNSFPGNIAFIMSLSGAEDKRFSEIAKMLGASALDESCQLALASLIAAKSSGSELLRDDPELTELVETIRIKTNLRIFPDEF